MRTKRGKREREESERKKIRKKERRDIGSRKERE